MVAAEGDQAGGRDLAGDLDGGRERVDRQGAQRLGLGQLPDRAPAGARSGVAGDGTEPVQRRLGLGGRLQPSGPPPSLGKEVDRLLDYALAIGAPGRAGVHADPVVLGDRGEAGLQAAGVRVDRGGHAVNPPAAGGPAEATRHPIQRLHQVRQVLSLGQHRPGLARVRQRPDQHVRTPAPRRAGQLHPVPLRLLSRRMGDLDRLATGHAGAGLAVGTQPPGAQRPGEARVAAPIAQRTDLVVQRGRPHVPVLTQPGGHVVDERGEPIRRR